jgi:long-chain acyl-CoA synthetase
MKERHKPYPLYRLDEMNSFKELLISQAMHYPHKTAFTYTKNKKEIKIDRLRLLKDVKALSTWLIAHGLKNQNIAILSENSYEWIVAFLAIVISGNIAVPVDKELDGQQAYDMMVRTDVSFVFASHLYSDTLDLFGDKMQSAILQNLFELIEEGQAAIDQGSTAFEDVQVDPNQTAAIFFTSATSGPSKGVMLSHKNILCDINSACKNFQLEGDTLALLPFHHCFGLITAIFMVFNYAGGTYINTSLKRAKSDFKKAKPQTIFLVPLFVENFHKSIWHAIVKSGKEKKVRQMMHYSNKCLKYGLDVRKHLFASILDEFGGNLEYIICGGAMLDEAYIADFTSWGIQILNGYGITECSPVVAVNRNHFVVAGSVGPILDAAKIKIGDDNEILVQGDMVMQGYYKDEEATKKALASGWFHTGDLGSMDALGCLHLLGRKKNLIILSNGENVSPEQIELALSKDKGICEVIVYAKNNQICASIYPDKEYINDESYFQDLLESYNRSVPFCRRIASLELRKNEFEKNTTQKILRYKVTGEVYE